MLQSFLYMPIYSYGIPEQFNNLGFDEKHVADYPTGALPDTALI